MAGHAPNPVEEVQDHEGFWPFFEHLFKEPVGLNLPSISFRWLGLDYEFQLTKFMILELIAAALIIGIYVPLARKAKDGGLPTGWFWNLFEGLLTFIRDEVARPNLDSHDEHAGGHAEHAVIHGEEHHHKEHAPAGPEHEADKFLPFLWTLFLFVLFLNLLGMIPLMGSPTASIWVTAGLAIISFVVMHGVAIAKYGPVKYLVNLWPKMGPALIPVSALIFVIEMFGTVIKSFVLAVRLFANMFAGHLVLATILSFILVVANAFGTGLLWGGVTVASVLGVVALSLLELFVACLQAYIFTFLTALFMGMGLHHGDH
jgi:F-type H+-transporting ATPase subunit a